MIERRRFSMKLAEALQIRADIQTKIDRLKQRLLNNVLKQDGVESAEDPQALLSELDSALNELENLIYRINMTNANTITDSGNLTQLIAKKDVLKKKIQLYDAALNAASEISPRYGASEIRIYPNIDIQVLRQKMNRFAKEHRELEFMIQEKNWTTDLID